MHLLVKSTNAAEEAAAALGLAVEHDQPGFADELGRWWRLWQEKNIAGHRAKAAVAVVHVNAENHACHVPADDKNTATCRQHADAGQVRPRANLPIHSTMKSQTRNAVERDTVAHRSRDQTNRTA